MKRILFFLSTLTLFNTPGSHLFAQALEDVARSKSITWYGIDFSQARFLHFGDRFTAEQIKKEFQDWSMDPLSKNDEDMIKGKYSKSNLMIDLRNSRQRNAEIDFSKRLVSESYDMDHNDITELISEYEINGEGYGLLLVVEGFENRGDRAYVWAVFINKSNKKIIAAKRFVCETHGEWRKAMTKAVNLSGKYLHAYK